MYKEHPLFMSPSDNAVLWRYLDFTKFISLLESSNLYFTRADKFSDLFEGTYTKASFLSYQTQIFDAGLKHKHSPSLLMKQLQQIKASVAGNRKYVAVNCWHMNEFESAAMWSLYLKSNEGIAIKTKFSRLKSSFSNESKQIYIGAVNYLNYAEDFIDFGNVLAPFVCKRKSFEHEREVRALVYKPVIKDRVIDYVEDSMANGLDVNCDLDTLVEAIYVAPTAPEWFSQLIKDVVKRYEKNWPVHQSMLDEAPFN